MFTVPVGKKCVVYTVTVTKQKCEVWSEEHSSNSEKGIQKEQTNNMSERTINNAGSEAKSPFPCLPPFSLINVFFAGSLF